MGHYRKGLPALTPQQKIFYAENGYILIERNVSEKLMEEVKQRFMDICNGNINHQVYLVMKEPSLKMTGVKGEYVVDKLQDFLNDEILWKYASDDAVVDVVEEIIGPNIVAIHSMFINKPPNADAGSSLHPMHQDMHYFPLRPSEKIVASWTALERVNENNGCLYVVPGSHKGPLYAHTYPDGFKKNLYHGVQGFENLKKKFVIMNKGDTVFFHPHLLHGSGPNRTQGFRKAISCHYASSDCEFIDVKGTIQENLAKEIQSSAQKVFGLDMAINELWTSKSRLVRGRLGKFHNASSHL
ncbi:phytanoyl-CoA dioxygenase, peroxisomal-like [Euwallacea fornicatus]|uniref:phytanoyl-CoA dioxygenase, peroxisomal-like n=1 Tax=Euwallacea fornicatus TaxID=995702 RepID=UPI00338D65BD